MDGNGRWAGRRLMPRSVGHKAGVEALVRAVKACLQRGIPYLTVFAFSSENWKRPQDEVSGLMSLVLTAMSSHLNELSRQGVRIRMVGERSAVSEKVRQAWIQAEEVTRHNERMVLSVAFNYGGRWDIVQACRRALASGVSPGELDEATVARHLALAHAPDPDLLIRTGGELRLSNFLLWQAAYAELYFSDCLWPDFDDAELDRALQAYAARDRRFGQVSAMVQEA
jgi:undecaprenyl diphosphate synthase